MATNSAKVAKTVFASSMDVLLKRVKAAKEKMVKVEEVINIATKDTRGVSLKHIGCPKHKSINPKAFDAEFQKRQDKEVKQKMEAELEEGGNGGTTEEKRKKG